MMDPSDREIWCYVAGVFLVGCAVGYIAGVLACLLP
jgi:hypothetical protein